MFWGKFSSGWDENFDFSIFPDCMRIKKKNKLASFKMRK